MNLKAMYKNIGYGDTEIEEIESTRKNYQTSVYYMDIVSELEKMGDSYASCSVYSEIYLIEINLIYLRIRQLE